MHMLLFTEWLSEEMQDHSGWSIVVCTAVVITVNMAVVLKYGFRYLWLIAIRYYNRCKKKKARVEPE